jgi:hypothetical protein
LAGQAVAAAYAGRSRTLPMDSSARVSAYIRAHSAPTDRIFVWGFQPDIYFFANRLPASRYLYATFQTGLIPWTNVAPGRDTHYAIVPGAMTTLLADLARSRPLFIVDCSAGPNRHWDKYPPANFPPLAAYLRDHYQVTESAQFSGQGYALYRRRPDDSPQAPPPPLLSPTAAARLSLRVSTQVLAPSSASAPFGADHYLEDGRELFFAHAPSALAYHLDAGGAHLRGGFGIRPGAYAPDHPGPTDGAEFSILWRPDGGEARVLWRQLLRPLTVPADRGTHGFKVDVPPGRPGRLELNIGPGPAGNNASDWTYWSDLLLEIPARRPAAVGQPSRGP